MTGQCYGSINLSSYLHYMDKSTEVFCFFINLRDLIGHFGVCALNYSKLSNQSFGDFDETYLGNLPEDFQEFRKND